MSWEQHSEDMCTILDALGIEKAAIAGNSAGTGVALHFALHHPERCQELILIAPLYRGNRLGLHTAARALMSRMKDACERALRDGIESMFGLYDALPSPIREGALKMVRDFDPASVATTARFLDRGEQPFDDLQELARLTMPVQILPGQDAEHPHETALEYLQVLPHARMVQTIECPLAG